MIKYREYRGGLQESLDTAREFSTLKDVLQYIQGEWNKQPFKSYIRLNDIQISDIKISYYCYDDRVKQELYNVIVNIVRTNTTRAYLVGFIYEETE